jgi:methionyl-tRNA formyltransferase
MSGAQKKIAVFTGDLSYSVRKGIVEIDNCIPELSWLIVVHSPKKPFWALLQSQWRNLKRNGWRWIPYTFADIWRRTAGRASVVQRERAPGMEFRDLSSRRNMRVLRVADIHSTAAIDTLTTFAPDLGLSLAAPILREPLWSLPRLGCLNLHKGKVPDYRGMPPAFWELWNDEQYVGCTIHEVDAKLDTGRIVCEARVERERYATLRGLQLRLDELGVVLMREAVKETLAQTARPKTQSAGGKTYRKPTLAQVATLNRRLEHATNSIASRPARLLKNAVQGGTWAAFRLGFRYMVTPRIAVLLFHRVSDSARDNLTVGIEQFERQMQLLSTQCTVLSIEEVIASEPVPRSAKPLVCVTFDDGYLDNYSNAAPILQRHSIPAAFFVTTGLIGTQGTFPHDVRRGNTPIPLMNWDQLRQLRRDGFTVGSHSVTHIDCAAEDENKVRAELAQSRDDLRREIGLRDVIFAYPYGGRQHMTPGRLELVKQAGYVACLSAYGGSNIGKVERYNVLRIGIHWEFTDRAFLYRCLGL